MENSLQSLLCTARENEITLLGIGVMSSTVVDSALELGKELNFPVMLIASRNQVEMDKYGSGYANNWNSERLGNYVREKAKELGTTESVYLCRDHGGPWQLDKEYKSSLETKTALDECLASYYEDMLAGYRFFHVDTSRDGATKKKVPLEVAVERTVCLVEKLELFREEHNLAPILYEISLEETGKNNCPIEEFNQYVVEMLDGFKKRGLVLPKFIVGDTGTYVRMDRNAGTFNESNVVELEKISAKNQLFLKEHNADYLPDDVLGKHGELGIVMSNVAPEFARAETIALLELAEKEKKFETKNISCSGFLEKIEEKVMASDKWKKWMESNISEEDALNNKEFRKRAVQVCGHYFFSDPEIKEARKQLYENMEKYEHLKPEEYVKANIKKSIGRYIKAFGLVNFNDLLKQ